MTEDTNHENDKELVKRYGEIGGGILSTAQALYGTIVPHTESASMQHEDGPPMVMFAALSSALTLFIFGMAKVPEEQGAKLFQSEQFAEYQMAFARLVQYVAKNPSGDIAKFLRGEETNEDD